jgi:hypothetical protein
MRDPLRQPERLCRARGNPSGHGQRLVERLVLQHRSVDQIPLRGLGAIQQSAGVDEFQSAMFAEVLLRFRQA